MEEFFGIIFLKAFKIASDDDNVRQFYIKLEHGDRSMIIRALIDYERVNGFGVKYCHIDNQPNINIVDVPGKVYQVTLENPFPEFSGTTENVENIMHSYCDLATYEDGCFQAAICIRVLYDDYCSD